MEEGLKTSCWGGALSAGDALFLTQVACSATCLLVPSLNAEVKPPRTQAGQVNDQILQDLQFRPASPSFLSCRGWAGQNAAGAVNALSAKVHLTQGNWQECISHCQAVMSSGNYGLWEDFAEAFRLENEKRKGIHLLT